MEEESQENLHDSGKWGRLSGKLGVKAEGVRKVLTGMQESGFAGLSE